MGHRRPVASGFLEKAVSLHGNQDQSAIEVLTASSHLNFLRRAIRVTRMITRWATWCRNVNASLPAGALSKSVSFLKYANDSLPTQDHKKTKRFFPFTAVSTPKQRDPCLGSMPVV